MKRWLDGDERVLRGLEQPDAEPDAEVFDPARGLIRLPLDAVFPNRSPWGSRS